MTGQTPGRARLLLLIWLAAVTCRAPLIGVAPVLPSIVAELGLSHAAGGLLFSLPVLMMAALAMPGGLLADRVGAGRMTAVTLVAIAAASALRALGGVWVLVAGTALLGAAIGLLQPALPRIVGERFADRIGFATAVYSTGFTAGSLAAVAATSAWLVPAMGPAGWRGTFVVWGVAAGATSIGWLRHLGARGRGRIAARRGSFREVLREVLADPLLWRVAVIQTTNSAAFYAASAWLTAYYESLGWPLARAALPLSVIMATGAIGGLTAPILTDRTRARRPTLLVTAAATVAGTAGFLAAPTTLVWLWSVLFGLGLFGNFSVSLALPVDLAPRDRVGAATGMVYTLCYAGGLAGPLLVGYLRDATGGFGAGVAAVLGLVLVMAAASAVLPETYGRATAGASRSPWPASSDLTSGGT